MSCQQTMAQTLKESGHRLTPQRIMILSAVRHAEGHVTATEILEEVKESYPYIDASTVYRTLNVLKQMRLVSETNMGGGESRYEWIEQVRHHHLICRDCDGVTLLDHRFLENLGTEILDDYGFKADIDHFAIFGVCKECRSKAEIA
ncbi:MAG: transcriptional repressor [Chloroflexi bacterium]|nr:transcriptional repressor [Chloroflexota bacterium]